MWKIALCIAAFRVAALWCTKWTAQNRKTNRSRNRSKNESRKTNRSRNRISPDFLFWGYFSPISYFSGPICFPIAILGPISGPIWFPILARRSETSETYFLQAVWTAARLPRPSKNITYRINPREFIFGALHLCNPQRVKELHSESMNDMCNWWGWPLHRKILRDIIYSIVT